MFLTAQIGSEGRKSNRKRGALQMGLALKGVADFLASISIELVVVLLGGLFFVWAVASFVRSHRRVAESLERLAERLELMTELKEFEKKRAEKDWVIGDRKSVV